MNRVRAFFVVMAAAIALAGLSVTLAAGQAPATAKNWTMPRTPDGQPDLQGIWSNLVSTPLERPEKLAGRELLTSDEVEAADKRAVAGRNNADRRDQQPGTVTDVGRAYNAFWFPAPGRPINRTSLIVDPPDGRVPPLTPQARTRFAAWAQARGLFAGAASPDGSLWNGGPGAGPVGSATDDEGQPLDGADGGVDGRGSRADGPEDRRLSERCLIWSTLPRFPGGYNSNIQIAQSPGFVVLQMEMIHDARIIPLDGRPHLPQEIRQWLGDSRGRWDGDTLVIDTTNFTDKAPFKSSFEGLHLVERLTRVDANTLQYQVTVDDPTTWTKPWTASWPLTTLAPSEDRDAAGNALLTVPRMFEYACHEGNYGLGNQLSGTRATEKADADPANTKKTR